MPDPDDRSLTERLIKLLAALGFNETRLRWKLMNWANRREQAKEQASIAAAHVAYAHSVCGHCGKILPRETRRCPGCDSAIEPRFVQGLRRAGTHLPFQLNVTMLLVALIAAAYARQIAASPSSFFAFDGQILVTLGGHYPPFELQGQWWRLATAVFLHGGLIHVLFNLMALTQIGPPMEETFGPGRALFFFMLTGIVANVPSLLMQRNIVGIGASGAIMGFAGLAAGWGHREGTSLGLGMRKMMLKWLLYTTILGLMLGVDHVAHFTGFAAGAALGLLFHGAPQRRGMADAAFGVVGFVLALATVGLILVPPALP